MEETKQERFKRLAENRVQRAIELIRILGNCSNTNNYKYTEKQVKQIFSTLRKELSSVESKFVKRKTKEFKLNH